jgi:hypothetical protein
VTEERLHARWRFRARKALFCAAVPQKKRRRKQCPRCGERDSERARERESERERASERERDREREREREAHMLPASETPPWAQAPCRFVGSGSSKRLASGLSVVTDACPGRKPPFSAVKHPARPYKNAMENRLKQENGNGA